MGKELEVKVPDHNPDCGSCLGMALQVQAVVKAVNDLLESGFVEEVRELNTHVKELSALPADVKSLKKTQTYIKVAWWAVGITSPVWGVFLYKTFQHLAQAGAFG